MSESDAEPIAVSPPQARAVPSLGLLYWAHFIVGATGFGGSMPWLRRMMVEQRNWLSAEEFNDAIAISQFLPGPNVFNLIVVLGPRFHGFAGVVAMTVGIMTMPFLFALGIGALYAQYGDLPAAKDAMRGIAPVAAGLMLTLGFKTAMAPSLRSILAIFAVLTFIAVAYYRIGLPLVLASLAPFAIAAAWWRNKK